MTKKEIIKVVSVKSGEEQKTVNKVIDAFIKSMEDVFKAHDSITFPGFGKFEMKYRAARQGRNPQTKEMVEIPACYTPSFKASKSLKETV